ncbi:LOW QUALITY PROTEIN: Reverse transcriptase [Phytophthora palmivora]|uniref:Reverse transcriptase n=1 Tax=Phytophthora palmivora TaxID=4796 RepID=A0A2P4YV60_9STRA|nr:LOW QUALITY PROTEIN: Reverse transcriptase [Phytophthora palmivora]
MDLDGGRPVNHVQAGHAKPKRSALERQLRRFGASEAIRHDREPGFMSDFFRAFNKILGQRQRATLAYRPQAKGSADRMVQTTTRAIKM